MQGFPTIRFFPAGGTAETDSTLYEGPRELQALVQYVNEKAGLYRTMFGTLLPVAGRVTALDDIIQVRVRPGWNARPTRSGAHLTTHPPTHLTRPRKWWTASC